MIDDLGRSWEELAGGEFDADRIVRWPSREHQHVVNKGRAGMLVAQTLNHGNEHRSQIATIITTLGLEPAELDGWHYAIETGRFREIPAGPRARRCPRGHDGQPQPETASAGGEVPETVL